jgi:hypothetical protein
MMHIINEQCEQPSTAVKRYRMHFFGQLIALPHSMQERFVIV